MFPIWYQFGPITWTFVLIWYSWVMESKNWLKVLWVSVFNVSVPHTSRFFKLLISISFTFLQEKLSIWKYLSIYHFLKHFIRLGRCLLELAISLIGCMLVFSKILKNINKEILEQVFPCEFCEVFQNTFFTEQLRTTASGYYLWNPLQILCR